MFFSRIKDLISSGFVNPDTSLSYDLIQAYVNETVPKISSPLLINWKTTLEGVPSTFNYTHLYEYLIKRTVVVLTAGRGGKGNHVAVVLFALIEFQKSQSGLVPSRHLLRAKRLKTSGKGEERVTTGR